MIESLQDASLIATRFTSHPMKHNLKLNVIDSDVLSGPQVHHKHVGLFIYLIITRHDIVFDVNVLNHFMYHTRQPHLHVIHNSSLIIVPQTDFRINYFSSHIKLPSTYCYYDLDWISCLITRHSTILLCIVF
jgi:hypothetical protein